MSAQKQKTAFYIEDVTYAVRLADKFNVASAAPAQKRATAIISKAIDFIHEHKDMIQKGGVIECGSAWHGPECFLDKDIAQTTARLETSADEIAGRFDIALTQADQKKLSAIRKCFNLSSNKQAGRLAVQTYGRMVSSLWQGNGFSITDKDQDQQTLDTTKVKSGLTFRY